MSNYVFRFSWFPSRSIGSSNMRNFVTCTVMNCFLKKIARMRVLFLMHSAEVCKLVQQMPPVFLEDSTVMPRPHLQIQQPKGNPEDICWSLLFLLTCSLIYKTNNFGDIYILHLPCILTYHDKLYGSLIIRTVLNLDQEFPTRIWKRRKSHDVDASCICDINYVHIFILVGLIIY